MLVDFTGLAAWLQFSVDGVAFSHAIEIYQGGFEDAWVCVPSVGCCCFFGGRVAATASHRLTSAAAAAATANQVLGVQEWVRGAAIAARIAHPNRAVVRGRWLLCSSVLFTDTLQHRTNTTNTTNAPNGSHCVCGNGSRYDCGGCSRCGFGASGFLSNTLSFM